MNKIRQVAPDLSGIRDDHVARYQFAINEMLTRSKGGKVLDVGCGVGYGSRMMSDAGFDVIGIDPNQDAIDYANEHYGDGQIIFKTITMQDYLDEIYDNKGLMADFLTMFEVIEHSRFAPNFLDEASTRCGMLFGSVPNEDVVPFISGKVNPEHYRHYTPEQIWDELIFAGFNNLVIWGQPKKRGPGSEVVMGQRHNRALVFIAEGTPI